MNIGNSISDIRKTKELSQEQFGKMFHVTRQTVSNWENEKSYPDLQTLIKISDTFELSLDQLIKEDQQMIQKIDKERRFARKGKIIILILVLILLLLGMFVKRILDIGPTEEGKRNLSNTDAIMYLNLPDQTPSRAIVNTFEKEEYDNFSENKLRKIRDTVEGSIEGDIPALMFPGPQRIYFTFQDIMHCNTMPDEAPTARLTEDIPFILLYGENADVPDSLDTETRVRDITLSLDENGYYIEFDNPFTREALDSGADSIFCMIEVSYTANGNDYVSVSAFNEMSTEAGF